MAYTSRHTGAQIDRAADLSGVFHVVESGSVASVTSGTTQRAQWKGNSNGQDVSGNSVSLITSLKDGLTITFRPSVAGDSSRGVTLNVNNLGEHPVVINASGTTIGTRCAVGNTILLTYNSTKTASVIVGGVNTSFTGVWQVVNFEGGNASTATIATKLGTSNVGSSSKPIYLEAGVPKEATIPTASSSTLGLVKSSTTGTMSGRDYNVQVNSDGTMKVNVPWSYTFTNKNASLSWGSTTTIANVGGTDITVKMPSNPQVEIKDNLTSTSTSAALSANQGKVLKGLVDGKAASSHQHYSSDIKPPSYTTGSGMPNLYETYVQDIRANRFAFMPPEQIYIESSTDGGATWSPVSFYNGNKTMLFSRLASTSLQIPIATSGVKSCDCLLRITMSALRFKTNSTDTTYSNDVSDWIVSKVSSTERYCSLDHMYIWCCSVSDRIYCKVEYSTGTAPTTWISDGEGYMSGWSGGNYIKLSGKTFGGSTGQTGNYWHRRITFRTCATDNTFDDSKLKTGTYAATAQTIQGIFAFGRNCWSSSNTMMRIDHLYDYDYNKTAIFPGRITCSAPTGDNDAVTKKFLTDTMKSAISDTLGGSY